VDIVVKCRHVEVSERFRTHAQDKVGKVERLDPSLQRVDVEVTKETNPRLADRAFRVELTCRGRGPVIRAEAAADDKFAALDVALGKLEGRLRRAADRRTDRKKHDRVGAIAVPDLAGEPGPAEAVFAASSASSAPVADGLEEDAWSVPDDGPMIVREKTHLASPMNLDQALYEMELVGHDFFLFVDLDSGRPSVVYRRRGYDYGVIRLDVAAAG
jgi:ribosomal subunit interface protein